MNSLAQLQRGSAMLALALMLVPAAAFAQWVPTGIAFTGSGVLDPTGGILLANSNYAINRIDSLGVRGTQLSISRNFSATCPDGSGGIICVAGGTEMYVARVRNSLTLVWGADITASPGNQDTPACASDGAGGVLVAWNDARSATGPGNNYDVYAQRVDSTGAQKWTTNGVPVCTVSGNQTSVAVASDGSGGMYIAWYDQRAAAVGGTDIYAQHLNSVGVPLWAADGIPVCNAAGIQQSVVVSVDGVGGCYIAWWDLRGADYDIYLQRLNSAGAASFSANGLLVAGAVLQQIYPQLLPDGSQGVYMCWEDHRGNGVPDGSDIYERHVNGSGGFVGPELAVCTESHQQKAPAMIADGVGGQIISWTDTRPLLTAGSIFAQRFDASSNPMWAADGVQVMPFTTSLFRLVSDGTGGAYVMGGATMRIHANGTPAWVDNYSATIVSVSDASLDEGGFVRLSLTAAVADATVIPIAPANFPLPTAYEVWRKVPGSAALSGGIARLANRSIVHPAGVLTSLNLPAGTWEVVGTAYAHGWLSYAITVPTHSDSTALSVAADQFVVMTVTTDRSTYCFSSVGTGHSVDNIAPPPPPLLVGGRTGATTAVLSWQPSTVADLARYSVYRGDSPSFTIDPAHRIGVTSTPVFNENAFSTTAYYKVTAVDRHGNESAFSMLAPSDFTSVAPVRAPRVSYAAIVGANPFTRRAVIEYGLAQAGRMDLAIYDLAGRKVASLVDGERPAGVQRVAWEGGGDSGSRLGAGVYLARFAAPGVSRTLRLVRVE